MKNAEFQIFYIYFYLSCKREQISINELHDRCIYLTGTLDHCNGTFSFHYCVFAFTLFHSLSSDMYTLSLSFSLILSSFAHLLKVTTRSQLQLISFFLFMLQ